MATLKGGRSPAYKRFRQHRHETFRQYANAILVALGLPSHDLPAVEVKILDPEVERLREHIILLLIGCLASTAIHLVKASNIPASNHILRLTNL